MNTVGACRKLIQKQANLLMIIILFAEGEEVDRVYRLSVERVIVYQRENVERSTGLCDCVIV